MGLDFEGLRAQSLPRSFHRRRHHQRQVEEAAAAAVSTEQAGASCPCSWLLDADSEYLVSRGGCWGAPVSGSFLVGEEKWGIPSKHLLWGLLL